MTAKCNEGQKKDISAETGEIRLKSVVTVL